MIETITALDKYEQEHPELAEKTYAILGYHKNILDYLKKKEEEITSEVEQSLDEATSLQKRIKKATDPNRRPGAPKVKLLDGRALTDVSEPQRKAYLTQCDRLIECALPGFDSPHLLETLERYRKVYEKMDREGEEIKCTKAEWDEYHENNPVWIDT